MASLHRHMTDLDGHDRLAFRADCPRCRARLRGHFQDPRLLSPRGEAAAAAGLLAVSSLLPAAGALAGTHQDAPGTPAPATPPAVIVDDADARTDVDIPPPEPHGNGPVPVPDPATPSPPPPSTPPAQLEPAPAIEPAAPPTPAQPSSIPQPPLEEPPPTPAPSPAQQPPAPAAPASSPSQPQGRSTPSPDGTREPPASRGDAKTGSSGARERQDAARVRARPVDASRSPERPSRQQADSGPQTRGPSDAPRESTTIAQADTAGGADRRHRSDPRPATQSPDSSRAPDSAAQGSADRRTHVVQPGECLWTIAERELGAAATAAQIAALVDKLWRLNAARVGTGNPNLIHAGQGLQLP